MSVVTNERCPSCGSERVHVWEKEDHHVYAESGSWTITNVTGQCRVCKWTYKLWDEDTRDLGEPRRTPLTIGDKS